MVYILLIQNLSASEVIATVDNANITQEEVDLFVKRQLPASNFNLLTPDQQKTIIDKLIDSKLFLEDAKKIKIDETEEFKEALKSLKEKLMLDLWMKKRVEEIKISDMEAKTYYLDNKDKFYRPTSVKVRHILLSTKQEAEDIIRELKYSKNNLREKFIELAKKKSTGPSAVNGGELNWFIKEQMVPEFSEAAFSLKKGTITKEPIKTQFGYHVIYLEDKKEQGLVPFEVVKPNIVKILRGMKFKEKLARLSKKLRKTATITVK